MAIEDISRVFHFDLTTFQQGYADNRSCLALHTVDHVRHRYFSLKLEWTEVCLLSSRKTDS